MLIDSHQHFWKFDAQRDAWITEDMQVIRRDFLADELHHTLRENGIDGCVAVQADQSEAETAFLHSLAEENDFIKGVVGWVDLRSKTLPGRLDHYRRHCLRIKGFRHIVQGEPDDDFLLQNDFCEGVTALKDFGYTYDILIYPKQLPAALKFVERFPDQPFVIDHLAKPFIKDGKRDPWAAQMREIAKNGNVYCKVSGMVTEADWKGWKPDDFKPYLDVVFEAFGPDRLMFGSDWPVCLVSASYAQVKGLVTDYLSGFSEKERQAVMGGNATAFYNL